MNCDVANVMFREACNLCKIIHIFLSFYTNFPRIDMLSFDFFILSLIQSIAHSGIQLASCIRGIFRLLFSCSCDRVGVHFCFIHPPARRIYLVRNIFLACHIGKIHPPESICRSEKIVSERW